MRIAICDDKLDEINLTTILINKWAKERNVRIKIATFKTAESFLFQWESHNYDMLFLDINLENVQINGHDLAKKIRETDPIIEIVYLTGCIEYVFKGYDVNILQFLIKPLTEINCFKCLDQAYEKIKNKKSLFWVVRIDNYTRKLPIGNIYYFESLKNSKNKVSVHTTKDTFQCNKTISSIVSELPASHFIQCHKSYIVNLLYVNSISKDSITLDNNESLALSRHRYPLVHEAFLKYHFNINKAGEDLS